MKRSLSIFLSLLMLLMLSACSSAPNPTAVIETSMGGIEVEIFADQVPEMAKNFMELAKAGKYDGVPFHRVIKGFMIQTGDFEKKDGTGGHSYKGQGKELAGEYGKKLSNVRGTLSYANRGPDTNGSQFFINLTNNSFLDHDKVPLASKHPVFAKVIKGMEVVDAISIVETKAGDRPKTDVLMINVTISEPKQN